MRAYLADLSGEFHDLRGLRAQHPSWYNAEDYGASQQLGLALRQIHASGLLYESVRQAGGENAAVLRPPVLSACRQGPHFGHVWNGERISDVVERKETSIHL